MVPGRPHPTREDRNSQEIINPTPLAKPVTTPNRDHQFKMPISSLRRLQYHKILLLQEAPLLHRLLAPPHRSIKMYYQVQEDKAMNNIQSQILKIEVHL